MRQISIKNENLIYIKKQMQRKLKCIGWNGSLGGEQLNILHCIHFVQAHILISLAFVFALQNPIQNKYEEMQMNVDVQALSLSLLTTLSIMFICFSLL